jgi:hypothetical protein
MTTKKKTQAGSKGKLPTLKEKAREVIANSYDYDADTRRHVWLALQRIDFARTHKGDTKITEAGATRELKECLSKAARGVPLFDVASVGEQFVAAARMVYDLLEGHSNVPEFIYNAARVALEEVARRNDRNVWILADDDDSDSGGFSVERMALLFKYHELDTLELEPKRDLAGHISAVLNHPDTPSDIYNALAEAVTTLTARDEVTNTAEVIRLALALDAERKAGA